jgi:hypothetical protein
MGGPLTGYEAESIIEVEAVLDESPADADEVYQRTIGHSERAIAAVAAKRAGGGGGGGGPAVGTYTQVATVDLTNAQVLALPTTPVTIVSAVAGKLLLPTYAALWAKLTADYTNIDANCTVEIDLGNANADWALSPTVEASGLASGLLASSGGNVIVFATQQFAGGVGAAATSFEAAESDWVADGVGQPITLSVFNHASGNFTGGDAANKLRVTVQYLTVAQP